MGWAAAVGGRRSKWRIGPGWGFGPAAVAVDAAVGAHGAKDGVAGECDVVDGFDEGVEGGVQTFAALEEQAGGAGVTVDGAIVVEFVVLREFPGGAPVDEFLFDRFAIGMVADDAAAAVSFEEERLQLLLQSALAVDAVGLFHRPFTECFREGLPLVFGLVVFVVVFEVMLGCPFVSSRAAGRGRGVVRREIVRLLSGGWRRPTFFSRLLGVFWSDANPT